MDGSAKKTSIARNRLDRLLLFLQIIRIDRGVFASSADKVLNEGLG